MRSTFVIVNAINRMTPIFLQQLTHPRHYCGAGVDLHCPCYAIIPKIMKQGSKGLHTGNVRSGAFAFFKIIFNQKFLIFINANKLCSKYM